MAIWVNLADIIKGMLSEKLYSAIQGRGTFRRFTGKYINNSSDD